jgi:putative chitinase
MTILKEGSSGPKVKSLQRKLKELRFNPGLIDGDFGPATKAALLAFQKSEGLLADGIAGPQTTIGYRLL